MSDLLIIDLIFYAVVFSPLLMIAGSLLLRSSNRKEMASLAGPLGAVEINSWMDPAPSYQAELNGLVFNFEVPHRKHDPGFYLSIPTDVQGHFLLTREDAVDRMVKAVGLSRELQTGDEAFDRAFEITMISSREFVQRSLADAETRAALQRLFALGFDTVGLVKRKGKSRVFHWPTRKTMLQAYSLSVLIRRSSLLDDPERVRESVRLLDLIRRKLPADAMQAG